MGYQQFDSIRRRNSVHLLPGTFLIDHLPVDCIPSFLVLFHVYSITADFVGFPISTGFPHSGGFWRTDGVRSDNLTQYYRILAGHLREVTGKVG